MENTDKPRFPNLGWSRNSLTVKMLLLGLIFIVLHIPLSMTDSQRKARAKRAETAEQEVSMKWGGRQTVSAPVMRFKLVRTVESKDGPIERRGTLTVLPEKLDISGTIVPELRYRGIYPVLLYRSDLAFEGEFAAPPLERALKTGWKLAPEPPTIQFGISDIKGITGFGFTFGGRDLNPIPGCEPPLGGVHCELPAGWEKSAAPVKFRSRLELNGCRDLLFQPVGKNFTLKLGSTWPHPSFTGGFLPVTRTIDEKGFHAEWKIGEVNRTYPQFWFDRTHSFDRKNDVGVALVQTSNAYRRIERVGDHASLIIVIVLAAFFVGEIVAKIWIHPLQYLFAGLSLTMFYMLLLALSEHTGFGVGYLVSAATAVCLCTGYAFAIFSGRRAPALILGVVVALAYALIYTLVRMEDYALLAGSLILLVMLVLMMKFTGRINAKRE